MVIQIDTRDKPQAITHIVEEFDKQGIKHFRSKAFVGDYVSLDNPRLAIDRKKNIEELCGNVCSSKKEHERFRNELIRARKYGIKLVVLCENEVGIRKLEDVHKWFNPRREESIYNPYIGKDLVIKTRSPSGKILQKSLITMQERYGCIFLFCSKEEMGKKIIEILSGGLNNDS
jgi:hypothetical protein